MSGHDRAPGKLARKQRSIQLEQLENRTLCTVNNLQANLALLLSTAPATNVRAVVANAAPTVAQSISVRGSASNTVVGTSTELTALGADDQGESQLRYQWRVLSGPTGGLATFSANDSNPAKRTTVTFNKAGNYNFELKIIDRAGRSTTTTRQISVAQTLTRVALLSQSNTEVSTAAPIAVSGSDLSLRGVARDQFGAPMLSQPALRWTAVNVASGGRASLRSSGSSTTITVDRAGNYSFQLQAGNASLSFRVAVAQTLRSLRFVATDTRVEANTSRQLSIQGVDQFGQTTTTTPAVTWSATSGSVSNTGLFRAAATPGQSTVTARAGTISATLTLAITAPSANSNTQTGLTNAALSNLVSTYFADGSITRPEMIQLLRAAGNDGTVDNTELTDLRYVVSNASRYNIPGYVQVLASNVVNSNPANALFQGAALGNLAVGSAARVLNQLVDKWFLGTDRPTLTNNSINYRTASGPLFVGTPSFNNEKQGSLGDCYFISALGSLATSNPDAVRNMFIDNGDGTFTIRFFGGTYGSYYNADGTISDGFSNGRGAADYVTVDRMLPSYSNGVFAYSNMGASVTSNTTPLWIALAEKAYAQWNATGKAGRNGTNTYAGIEGGWMGNVNAQVLGSNSTRYAVTSTSNKQALVNALSAGHATTIGTRSGTLSNGLVGSHAYSVTGYNAGNDTFTLFNPWGTSHPAPLTWAQIQANFTFFVVANARQVTPFVATAGGVLRSELAMPGEAAPPQSNVEHGCDEFASLPVATEDLVITEDDPWITTAPAPLADAADAYFADMDVDEDSPETRRTVDMLLDIELLDALLQDC